MSDRANQERLVSDSVGHVSVRLDHLHPKDVLFSFEDQRSRLSRAFGLSVVFHAVGVASFLFLAAWLPTIGDPLDLRHADAMRVDQIVWVAEPGPGGGGGGGGNQSIEPPRLAELPGKDKITVPVLKPPDLTPTPDPEDALPKQVFNIPAQMMASAETSLSGVLDSMRSSNSPTALGPGSGGGAGTGTGTGIGPGTGSGLGPGWGGGTGGGAYRPGAGIELPRLLREVKPQYTADAMRAKVQGTVVLDCVVTSDGNVSECDVVRSLDSSFGLDQEAVKAARQWRFSPGKRLGQPVPVLVTIELTFTLR
jgi:periplasmic protein TonB